MADAAGLAALNPVRAVSEGDEQPAELLRALAAETRRDGLARTGTVAAMAAQALPLALEAAAFAREGEARRAA